MLFVLFFLTSKIEKTHNDIANYNDHSTPMLSLRFSQDALQQIRINTFYWTLPIIISLVQQLLLHGCHLKPSWFWNDSWKEVSVTSIIQHRNFSSLKPRPYTCFASDALSSNLHVRQRCHTLFTRPLWNSSPWPRLTSAARAALTPCKSSLGGWWKGTLTGGEKAGRVWCGCSLTAVSPCVLQY